MRLRLLVLTALPLGALVAGLVHTAAVGPVQAQPPREESKKPAEAYAKQVAPVVEKY
jgi:hypothetical protein